MPDNFTYTRLMDPSGGFWSAVPITTMDTVIMVSISGGVSVSPPALQIVAISGSIAGTIPIHTPNNLTIALSGSVGGVIPVSIPGGVSFAQPIGVSGSVSVITPNNLTVALSGSVGGVIPVSATTPNNLTVAISGSVGGVIPVSIPAGLTVNISGSVSTVSTVGQTEGAVGSGSVVAQGIIDGGGIVWSWNNVIDAEGNTSGKRIAGVGGVVWNGTNWRYIRDSYAASGGIGLPASAMYGRDYVNSTWRVVGVDDRSQLQTTAAGLSDVIPVTGTISTSQYSEKDSLGGLWVFPNAVRFSGGRGFIQTITLTDKARASGAIDLVFLGDAPSGGVPTDNNPITLADGDLLKVVGKHSISNTDYIHFVDNAFHSQGGLGIEFRCVGTDLYCIPMLRNTPTYATASDITIVLGIIQD